MSYRIVCIASFIDVPFIFSQPVVVVGIDNGVFALVQGDSPVRIAVAQFPVEQNYKNGRLFKPIRNFDDYLGNFLTRSF